MDITRIALLSVVALLLLPATAHAQGKAAHKDAYLYFVWPQDGTVIKGAFWCRFGRAIWGSPTRGTILITAATIIC